MGIMKGRTQAAAEDLRRAFAAGELTRQFARRSSVEELQERGIMKGDAAVSVQLDTLQVGTECKPLCREHSPMPF